VVQYLDKKWYRSVAVTVCHRAVRGQRWQGLTYLMQWIAFNLLGGTILPRFLFQKQYVSGAAC